MGKFDGFLILSDIDGTFAANHEEVVAENAKAVKYFTENGGRFSFATGRMIEHLKENEFSELINAPACLYNGAMIYDYEKNEVVREGHAKLSIGEFNEYSRDILSEAISVNYFYKREEYEGTLVNVSEIDSFFKSNSELCNIYPIKIIVRFIDSEAADRFKIRAKEINAFKNTYISKSWAVGVEFNGIDSTKGEALDYIKSYLENIHTAIGIGDYENDISLLLHADLAAAVGGAIPELKEIADVITKPASEYAVKDLIEMLDSDPEKFSKLAKIR